MEAVSPSDPTQRFTSRVENYVKARPRYPQSILKVLSERIGLLPTWTIADIGSGTGISAELFLKHGNSVFAVEPNDAMRNAAERQLGSSPGFNSHAATAEATTLPAGSIDLVLAAQAFHWFEVDRYRAECRRILKPAGWALLMWNDRLLTGTPFLEAYELLLDQFGTDYKTVNHQNIGPEKLLRFFGKAPELVELPNEQSLDFDGLRARLLSSSYVPQEGHERFDGMTAALRAIFDKHQIDGAVTVKYRTQLYFGRIN